MNVGDLEWARTTGGRLGAMDRAKLMAEAVRFQMTQRLSARPKEVGASSAEQVERMLCEIVLPETEPVARALELVHELGPPELTGHVIRTWCWATALGLRDGLAYDREELALASLLHDLGLARPSEASCCFAIDGGAQARELVTQWGLGAAEAARVAEAIGMHLRVDLVPELGIEAHLLHAGAAADAIGARVTSLPREVRAAVLRDHPREGFGERFASLLEADVERHPESRMSLWLSLGFANRIRSARVEC